MTKKTTSNINPTSQKNLNEQTGRLYEIDTEQSQIIWRGEKITGNGHTGNVKISEGQITLDNDNNLISADFAIDMNSITESRGNQQVVTHLKSNDFFDAATYPFSKLKITKIEKVENNLYNVSGDLTIKGITQNIVFPAQITIQDDEIRAQAEFNIDRTLWNIKYGSGKFFKELADIAIKDEISFKVEIAAFIRK